MSAPLTWSVTRHRAFNGCRRRYWFDYYGSRDGWRSSAPPEARKLYRLKRLHGPSQWLGILVHEAAAQALDAARGKGGPSEAALKELTIRRAKRAVQDARAGLPALDPKRYVGFSAMHYGEELRAGSWEGVIEELGSLLDSLVAHPVFRRLVSVPERILEVEEMHRIHLGDVPAWVSLDALVRDGRGGLVVLDWKTGRFHVDATVDHQLGVYAAYAQQVSPRARTVGLHVDVRRGRHRRIDLSAADAEKAVTTATASFQAMRAMLPDSEQNDAPRDLFPVRPADDPLCTTCRYREACNR